MFCHDNGKVCILAVTRCGHTSMTGYFGFEPYTNGHQDWNTWYYTKSRRVLVLRNPFDRLKSAILHSQNSIVTEGYTVDQWIDAHSRPYLHIIKRNSFEIIPFENLEDYIPVHGMTAPTYTSEVKHYEVEYTPVMRKEYEIYRYLRQHCNVISPEEWKDLTTEYFDEDYLSENS